MLNKMEKNNLIYRKQSEVDKRKKYIFLTPKGKTLESKSKEINDKMGEIFYKDFTENEIEIFENALKKIILNLEGENDDK